MYNTTLFFGIRIANISAVIRMPKSTATDPVQKLFLEKIREYKQKSAGGKLVEATPVIEKELKSELSKLEAHYGIDVAVDMTAFPSFKFEEPKLDPIDDTPALKPGKSKKPGKK